ncbi:hypothetical protein LTR36_003264 [Oleoguttula mirabilis]|uniref:FAD dependent oxidoreductase domain-containing protein n=1 Tax=Oleoguttula mirabilis TaxID=1507867 RepID=A0AAV9JX19_9PEZI|nr:hypothetical protein LTR36_003264 [Oleoguttula mirabilis]
MPPILEADPGIPIRNPTTPYWQVPRHSLAEVSSAKLPAETDVVIIGSGMTACSVAKTLLQQDDSLKMTVLEARGLASGASSRNGGHIVSPSFQDFGELIESFGVTAASEIAEFTLKNIEKTFDVVAEYAGTSLEADSKIRRTEKVIAYIDQTTYDKARRNLRLWNQAMPEHRRDPFRLLGAQEAKVTYGLQNVVGVAVGPGAAVWPYRLWCGLWSLLLKEYSERLSIETMTPALSVTANPRGRKYTVHTHRGEIRASHVVYCTNGFTPHLLPRLRGKLFPLRGTMSAQDLGSSFPNRGNAQSWSFVGQPTTDLETGATSMGLYYLTQDPDSGLMLLGGEHDKAEVVLSSDDSTLNTTSAEKVLEILPRVFDNVTSTPDAKSIWSGIMGFARDGLPLIGELPAIITGRQEGGEWIAAGFNGYGTAYCLSCGQAVAEMILGKDVSSWMPSALLISRERFESGLTSGKFWDGMIGLGDIGKAVAPTARSLL